MEKTARVVARDRHRVVDVQVDERPSLARGAATLRADVVSLGEVCDLFRQRDVVRAGLSAPNDSEAAAIHASL
jgi:hypothetical protein